MDCIRDPDKKLSWIRIQDLKKNRFAILAKSSTICHQRPKWLNYNCVHNELEMISACDLFRNWY
jgi:hypothetical protein